MPAGEADGGAVGDEAVAEIVGTDLTGIQHKLQQVEEAALRPVKLPQVNVSGRMVLQVHHDPLMQVDVGRTP